MRNSLFIACLRSTCLTSVSPHAFYIFNMQSACNPRPNHKNI
jgi:hypothetical protein